ncbi:cellulose binding domain-containing protein [Streptomyces sp. NPDC002666]
MYAAKFSASDPADGFGACSRRLPLIPGSGAVTATGLAYNATVEPGASVQTGFQTSHSGNTGAPASFSANGAACPSG